MKLSTGKVAFPIEFDNGDKEVIYFNPNDPDLMIRIKNLENRMQDKINGFEDIELEADGTPTDIAKIDIFDKMQAIFKEELNYAFGSNISEVVFKHCSPFAIVGGEYFVVQFINAIAPEIQKYIEKANEDARKRMSKHLDKYIK